MDSVSKLMGCCIKNDEFFIKNAGFSASCGGETVPLILTVRDRFATVLGLTWV